jgi:hypothetical protein
MPALQEAAAMAKKTQGTQLYFIDPANDSVVEVGCVLNIDGIDTTNEQLDATCLSDLARRYESGLATPGQATFGINIDPTDASHLRLHQLKVAGTSLQWAVGWSDGTSDPTVDTAEHFDVTADRSWITFEGYMASFPFSFAQNAFVTSNVGIQVSGEPQLFPKTA